LFLAKKAGVPTVQKDDTYLADKEKSTDENANKDKPTNEAVEWVRAIVAAVVLALLIRTFIFEIILVDGWSMLPTLEDRDRVFVYKTGYLIGKPQHGDVIIFKTPEDPHTNYVKRLIGLPGDKVKIENGVVYVNEERLEEPYILEPPYNDYAEVIVPEGTFFALGDNRNGSRDSRDYHVGFVPMKNLVGKAIFRVWPINRLSFID
jgi:signal peptidase I